MLEYSYLNVICLLFSTLQLDELVLTRITPSVGVG